ncbi:MAG: hypothetical protein DI598_14210 [Pseudopedobacter saltans]|uniref:YncE family protein n=1 Tax=Pseudopedobacter saltans TaxID=151895 RepID=A0A2W5EN08_9SPHI|nr:MAG: hypothetical protein DI598_14210 [Pseudopedobacter saltans]
MKETKHIVLFILIAGIICSCRKDQTVESPQVQENLKELDNNYARLYVLNEGNMNENRSTLDYYDYSHWSYNSNIYQTINPTVPNYLGDVGNDLQIYGSKMFAVVNMSNKIEVMDAITAKRLGQVNLINCRYITFDKGYAYVSSYHRTITGSTSGDTDPAKGIVVKIDTSTLQIVDSVLVGRQPDGVAVANGKLYVANSGGYSPKNYERTVSVIDLSTFKLIKNIDVAINLNLIQKDSENNLFVSSRGDYINTPSKLFKINTQNDNVIDSINIQVNSFYISKDTAYVIGTPFNWNNGNGGIYFKTINTKNGQVISDNFITDGTSSKLQTPYGILVNPESRNIYLTDALDYQTSGNVYCFSPQGKLIWTAKAGQVPAHFALLKK